MNLYTSIVCIKVLSLSIITQIRGAKSMLVCMVMPAWHDFMVKKSRSSLWDLNFEGSISSEHEKLGLNIDFTPERWRWHSGGYDLRIYLAIFFPEQEGRQLC